MNPHENEINNFRRIMQQVEPADYYEHSYKRQNAYHLAYYDAFPTPVPLHVSIQEDAITQPGHSLPVRIYTNFLNGAGPKPCILYLHGGGFVAGGLEAAEGMALDIVQALDCVVVTVAYRLAPEYCHPCAVEDVLHALEYCAKSSKLHAIDPDRIIVSGESSGGMLSAAICLYVRDNGGPTIYAQAPINPVLDLHQWVLNPPADCDPQFKREMYHFASHYLEGNIEADIAYASPLLADDVSNLPKCYIWAAGLDILTRESVAYGERLTAAGVPTKVMVHPDVVHGGMRGRRYYTFARESFDAYLAGVKGLLEDS